MIRIFRNLFREIFKRPIKIAIVIRKYPLNSPVVSGAWMHAYHLSRNLAELGCEVHVFTGDDRKDWVQKQRIGKGKVVVHFIDVRSGFLIKNAIINDTITNHFFEVRVLNQIMYENSKRWFDIIHTHGFPASGFMLKHFSKSFINSILIS